MSTSPFAVTSPTDPASYSWEATDEGVAERFGIPVAQVLRFDLNTSPAPPELVARLLREGRFETSLSEYPPGDYVIYSYAKPDMALLTLGRVYGEETLLAILRAYFERYRFAHPTTADFQKVADEV